MKRIIIQLTDEKEHEKVKREAKNLSLSISNYFRQGVGLPVMQVGAPANNQNRKGKKKKE